MVIKTKIIHLFILFNPYLLEWTDLAMKRQIDASKKYSECQNDKSVENSDLTSENGELKARVSALESDIYSSKEALQRCEQDRSSLQNMSSFHIALHIMMGLSCGGLFILAIILGILWRTEKSRRS